MDPEENAGLSVKDIDVIEYLYTILVYDCRNQLFNIKQKNAYKYGGNKIFENKFFFAKDICKYGNKTNTY
jgi:hypothetical protein